MTSLELSRPRPNIKFRVLIIGRANAGKTTILQRVCDTTKSPKVYRIEGSSRTEVILENSAQRGEHNVNDELIFENNEGYIFHDSRGFESGSQDELVTVQEFVRQKAGQKRLKDRLHAIWFCIPMDNQRPTLDMKYFNDVCPDKNVPIIAVFTKFDQFKFNVEMRLEDEGYEEPSQDLVDATVQERLQTEYIGAIQGQPRHVVLDGMHEPGTSCLKLITETAGALNDDAVAVMFVSVQKENLAAIIAIIVRRTAENFGKSSGKEIMEICLKYFPRLWVENWTNNNDDDDELDKDLERLLAKKGLGGGGLFQRLLSNKDNSVVHICNHLEAFLEKTISFSLDTHVHQVMIAVVVLLDPAVLLFVRAGYTNLDPIFEKVYLKATEFDIANKIFKHFSASYENYKDDDYVQFILENRLTVE